MKVVLLAGGLGTRLSEETTIKPKPLVEIGGMPILWHIMKLYSAYGFNEFIVCLGYKGHYIKEWFSNYYLRSSDVTFDLGRNTIEYHKKLSENWKVSLIDTGEKTMTGGRLKRIQNLIQDDTFMMTYGDGVSDVDLHQLLNFHRSHGKAVTLTAIQPEGRFGSLDLNEKDQISAFVEKPKGDLGWINGGFFVCEPKVMDYIAGDEMIFEQEPLKNLARDGELHAYKHHGFWQCMDTLSNKEQLNSLWDQNQAAWKVWDKTFHPESKITYSYSIVEKTKKPLKTK